MAKPKISISKHGATFIYQKDPTIRGTKIAIAFRGGAQFDGNYTGLSHLIEHLIFRELSDEKTKAFLDKTLAKCTNLDAYTSSDSITVSFAATTNDSQEMIKKFMKRILNKTFTQEQILKEIDVISHEIELTGDDVVDNTVSDDYIVNALVANKINRTTHDELLGTYKHLKKTVTPQVVADYINQYFTEGNLMVSMVSNEKFEDCVSFYEKQILNKVNRAKDSSFVAGYPEKIYFLPKNMLALEPDECSSGVVVKLYLRERVFESENPEFEMAVDTLESNLMTEIGGILWNEFRVKEPLTYLTELRNINVETSKFKVFTINTNKAKLNRVIKKLCDTLNNIAKNGVERKIFEEVQTALRDLNSSKMFRKSRPNALENLEDYIHGYHIVDEDKLNYYITHMTYEQYCDYIKNVYTNGQVSLRVTGDFDTRKCYNLIEIEEMLGNKAHSENKSALNLPRYEVTPVTLTDEEKDAWDKIVKENNIPTGEEEDDYDLDGGAD